MAERERIAIGIGARGARRAGGATGTGDILDEELLPERARELVRDDAGGDVGRPAGGERHHDRHRARGIALRLRAGNAGNECDRGNQTSHSTFHPCADH